MTFAILFLALTANIHAQRHSLPRPSVQPRNAVVTFHGVVKKVSKKELLIESDDKLITLRCSRKTKFKDQDGDIKPSDIDLESKVSVDASEDLDLKLLALTVTVEASPKKGFGK